MKSVIHHAKHYRLTCTASYYVQCQHFEFELSLMFIRRQCESNVTVKAINNIFNSVILPWLMVLFNSKALLSRWKPCDAALPLCKRRCHTEIYSGIARWSTRPCDSKASCWC